MRAILSNGLVLVLFVVAALVWPCICLADSLLGRDPMNEWGD